MYTSNLHDDIYPNVHYKLDHSHVLYSNSGVNLLIHNPERKQF